MSDHRTRRRFLQAVAGAGTVGLAGCLDAVTRGEAPDPEGEPVVGVDVPSGEDETFFYHDVSVSRDLGEFADEAVNGGVPKDGIPSVDDPEFAGVDSGNDRLDAGDPVFGVVFDGQARAYPQYILVSHEIVNDDLAGHSIAVTYCPLTGTAMGFKRGETTFGVSGMLVNNNLIMYDRSSESWWPQVLGTLVRGDEDADVLGRSLGEFRVIWTTWERWRTAYPDTEVLTEDTGEPVSYARDPYGSYNPRGGYYDSDNTTFERLEDDDRFHPKTVFIGARTSDGKVAFEKDRLREAGVLDASVGGVPYVAAYDADLDTGWVYRNPEGVEISQGEDGYETPGGEVAAHALPLEAVNCFDAMWFAWVGFYPNTEVVA